MLDSSQVVLTKKCLQKIPNLSYINFMSLKFIKTTQKCLVFWNLLGVLKNKVLMKSSKFDPHSIYFLKIFRNHPKMFHIFEFIRSFLGVNFQHIFQTLQNGAITGLQIGAREITNRGSIRVFKSGIKDCKSGHGFQTGAKRLQIGAKITNWGRRDYKSGQRLQIGAGITNRYRTHETLLQPLQNALTVDFQSRINEYRECCMDFSKE